MITASCGHVLTEEEDLGNHILICQLSWLREVDEDGQQAYSTETSLTVCNRCLAQYEEEGIIIRRYDRESGKSV